MSFRSRQIAVTTPHHEALKAYAAAHGLDGPDSAAELLLGERIDGDPDIAWIAEEYQRAMKELRKRTQERIDSIRT
jgi:hypothetical protein